MGQPLYSAASSGASFRFLQDIAHDLDAGEVSFPTFWAATADVRAAVDDPDIDADRLARVVMREPLLSAKLVKLANAAALNPGGRPVNDVKSAVVRVGYRTVRSVAISVAYHQLRADRELGMHRPRAEAVWRHSIQVAALAYVIALSAHINADEALFAGLVHDIGYFYLLHRASRYPDLAANCPELDAVLRDWHPAIGKAVLHALGLSPAILDAVGEHESAPHDASPRSLTDVIRIANVAAIDSNPAYAGLAPEERDTPDPQILELLTQSRDKIGSLVSALS